jgi:hypothetical protein
MKEANLKIYLKNFEDLMFFLNANYYAIDEISYKALLENTLGIYADKKPLDKDEALAELTNFYAEHGKSHEPPLFIHNTK